MASVVSARFLRQEDEVDKVIGHKVVASGDYVYEVLAWCKPFGTDDVSVRVRRTACERDPDLYGACAKVFEYQYALAQSEDYKDSTVRVCVESFVELLPARVSGRFVCAVCRFPLLFRVTENQLAPWFWV